MPKIKVEVGRLAIGSYGALEDNSKKIKDMLEEKGFTLIVTGPNQWSITAEIEAVEKPKEEKPKTEEKKE